MQQLVSNRWFALADLILVFTYGAVVTISPQFGGVLIVFALLPWLIRLASGRFTFERTAFVYPIALIVLSAGIGIWAAYDQQAAWGKILGYHRVSSNFHMLWLTSQGRIWGLLLA